jgi:tellurite resistance protein
MNEQERDGVLTIAMLAAFADGNNSDQERAEIRRIAGALGAESGANMPLLYQNVLLKKVGVDDAAAMVTSGEGRALAYEFAAGVCNADGALSPAEIAFLASLQTALRLAEPQAGEGSPQRWQRLRW